MDPTTPTPEPPQPELRRYPPGLLANKTSDKAAREERRTLVATLLLTRASYRQIIDAVRTQLGYETSLGTIHNDVSVIRHQWAERTHTAWDAHVSEQMAYLDGLLRAVMPDALRGDTTAVTAALGILDRRAKMLGLNAPDRVVVAARIEKAGGGSDLWEGLPRDEQLAKADEIMAILREADVLPSGNGQHAIDVEGTDA